MGLFSGFFGGAGDRNDKKLPRQQDAGSNYAQCDPKSLAAANDLAARAKRLMAEIRFEEAEPLLRQSLAFFERACGPNHPRVAEALCDLAKVLQDCDEAEALYRRSLAIAEAAFGPDHPNVVIPLHGMAVSFEVLSFRYQEAEELYRRCLAISEAAYGPDDPKVAQIMERIAVTLEHQSRYEEAESLYRRSLAIMEGVLGPDHPNVARTRKELAALSNKSHGTGLLRREGGKKYLRIDGAHAVVHACSTVEGYLERYANDGIGNIELKWFVDGAIKSSRSERPAEQQECCYCEASLEVEPRFPNTSVDVECPHCGRGQTFYVIQMTPGLEQDLGMENRLGGGYATIWLTVPRQHPEFSALLTKHGVVTWKSPHRSDLPEEMVEQDLIEAGLKYTDTWQDILWFDRFKDQEEMQWYRDTLSGVETLVFVSTTEERAANEIVVSYEVSSFEPHEHLDTDGCYITGRVHSGTCTVSASPSDLDELDDFPRSQVWGKEKTADFINRSAENNYQLSDGRYVPEAYSTMLRIVESAGFRFAVYKEGIVELWSEVSSIQPPSGKSVAVSEDWPGANQATEPDNYRLSVAGSDGRPDDAQHFMLLQFWMEPTASRELLLRTLEMVDASSFDYELGNAAIDALLASGYLHTLENHEFSITELGLQECIRWNLEYDLLIPKPSGMLDYTVDMVQYLVSEREPRISEEALSRILAPYIDKYTALYNRNR